MVAKKAMRGVLSGGDQRSVFDGEGSIIVTLNKPVFVSQVEDVQ